jgi:hypothetical protein
MFENISDEELNQMLRDAKAAGDAEQVKAIRSEGDRRSAVQMRAANSASHNPVTGQAR